METETTTTNGISATQRPKRRWFRYSLRTFLLVITALCVWLGWKVEAARKQREAVAAIRGICENVTIKYDYEVGSSLAPSITTPLKVHEAHWLSKYIGIDFFHDVAVVYAHPGRRPNSPTDVRAIFPFLSVFRRLRYLNIIGGTFKDDDFRHLSSMRDLEILFLNQNSISGEGLKHLRELRKLRQLVLVSNPITDQGIEAAAELANLQELQIGIGHGGTREPAELSRITDQCIESLMKMSELKRMHFEETNVSADAVVRLKKALPTCIVFYDGYAAAQKYYADQMSRWERSRKTRVGAATRASEGKASTKTAE